MKLKDLEEGKVYVNEAEKYCQVKELTRWNDSYQLPAYVVCSGDCNFYNDAKTNIIRNVFSAKQFIDDWEIYEEEDVEEIPVKDRTQSQHQQLIKKHGGIREYLLSMGAFKDVPMEDDWNFKSCGWLDFKGRRDVEKLKAKILEDISAIDGLLWMNEDLVKIIDKRFGF